MNKAQFNTVFVKAVNHLRTLVPIDTGHLAYNSIKGKWIDDNHFQIWIDRDVLENQANIKGEIANYYYAGRLNNDPSYRTYGFWEDCARKVAKYIAIQLNGEIK